MQGTYSPELRRFLQVLGHLSKKNHRKVRQWMANRKWGEEITLVLRGREYRIRWTDDWCDCIMVLCVKGKGE